MKPNDDFLEKRLRDEAIRARPAFSEELHERIMGRLNRTKPVGFWLWPALAAAAAIVIGSAVWFSSSPSPKIITPVRQVTQVTPKQLLPKLSPDDLHVRIGGVISAQLWPPQVGVDLPLVDAIHPRPVHSQPISQEKKEPKNPRQQLANVLPPEVRVLIAMTTMRPQSR